MGSEVPRPFLHEKGPGGPFGPIDQFSPERIITNTIILPLREASRVLSKASNSGYSWIQFKRDYCNWDYAGRRANVPQTSEHNASHSSGWEETYYMYDRAINPHRNILGDLRNRYVEPMFRNVITDMFHANTINPIHKCYQRERAAFECLEYYGVRQGKTLCRDYYDDLTECAKGDVQKMRHDAIRSKRLSRYYDWQEGKRPKEEVYLDLPPPHVHMRPDMNYDERF